MPSTPTEWLWRTVSVIIVGLVVGVASSLISRHLATPYDSFIDELLTRTPRDKARVNWWVDLMRKDSAIVTVIYSEHQSVKAWVRFWLLIACSCFLLAALCRGLTESSLQVLVTIPDTQMSESTITATFPLTPLLTMVALMLGVISLGLSFMAWFERYPRIVQAAINEFERCIYSGNYPLSLEESNQEQVDPTG